MKPSPRDYLTIAAALVAILLCGYGIGFLVGEHTTQARLRPSGDSPPRQRWEEVTLERLASELKLTDRQRNEVAGEITKSSRNINRARLEAVEVYQNEVLDLHQRILPYLDGKQRKQIEQSSRQLQKILDKGS